MTTEQRLERLERENRWMRRIGAVAVAVAAAVFLVGQGKAKELPDLVVRSLTVRDKNGKTRATLDADDEGVSLRLCGKDTWPSALLAVLADGGAGLVLNDKNSKLRASLLVGGDGSPTLLLGDKNGQTRAALGATETETRTAESTLTMYDAKGNVIWQAPR